MFLCLRGSRRAGGILLSALTSATFLVLLLDVANWTKDSTLIGGQSTVHQSSLFAAADDAVERLLPTKKLRLAHSKGQEKAIEQSETVERKLAKKKNAAKKRGTNAKKRTKNKRATFKRGRGNSGKKKTKKRANDEKNKGKKKQAGGSRGKKKSTSKNKKKNGSNNKKKNSSSNKKKSGSDKDKNKKSTKSSKKSGKSNKDKNDDKKWYPNYESIMCISGVGRPIIGFSPIYYSTSKQSCCVRHFPTLALECMIRSSGGGGSGVWGGSGAKPSAWGGSSWMGGIQNWWGAGAKPGNIFSGSSSVMVGKSGKSGAIASGGISGGGIGGLPGGGLTAGTATGGTTTSVVFIKLPEAEEDTDIPTALPTFSPTLVPTTIPTTYIPTYEPTELDTAEPTGSPTLAPTYNVPSFSPTPEGTTTMPTSIPTEAPTVGTEMPTANPSLANEPTISPSFELETTTETPTVEPTVQPSAISTSPTVVPTVQPTIETDPPTIECFNINWFYWGAEDGRGGSIADDQQVPELQDEDILDVSAGSRYTLLIDQEGDAYASGFIESKFEYLGRFGVASDKLVEGQNSWQKIDTVADLEGKETKAPAFEKAYAGPSANANSGEQHSLLIDQKGKVFTFGNNERGQLCLGDTKPRYIPNQVELDGPAVAAAIGEDFTLILLDDGSVYGCGSNEKGELGLGNSVNSVDKPNNDNGLSNIIDLSSGLNYALFQSKNGDVFSTGSNIYSQQCVDTDGEPITTPEKITSLSKGIKSIMAGSESSYFLFTNGSVGSCGRNDEGQLGDGSFKDQVKTSVVIPNKDKIIGLGSGPSSQSVFFIAEDGVVYGAGANDRYQLGLGDKIEPSKVPKPTMVKFEDPISSIQKISSSGTHTVAINLFECTAFPTMAPTSTPTEVPTAIPTSEPTVSPSIEPTGTPTLFPSVTPTSLPTQSPTLLPSLQPTALPTSEPTMLPTVTPTSLPTVNPTSLPTLNPSMIPTLLPSASPTFDPTAMPTETPTATPTALPTSTPTLSPTCEEETNTWLYWGADEGQGETLGRNQETPDLIDEDIIDVTAGPRYTLKIDSDGDAFASGFIESKFEYLGHFGVESERLNEGPNQWKQIDTVADLGGKEMKAPSFDKVYAGAAATANSGEMHSLLIDRKGNVYTTGNNDRGQLCLGDTDPRYIPNQVKLDSPAVAAAIGEDFTLILLNNGKVYGCGSNEKGELGLGNSIKSIDKPSSDNGLSNIVDISSGLSHALFQAENGNILATGSNIYTQLCEFTDGEPITTPKIISKLKDLNTDTEMIMAGRESSYFLLSNGSVKACGRNDEGQLGDGEFINSEFVDVKIPNGKDISNLGSGPSSQSVFFFGEDDVYGAGANDRFQLGIGEIGSQTFPVKVEFKELDTVEGIIKISSSGTQTVALNIPVDVC